VWLGGVVVRAPDFDQQVASSTHGRAKRLEWINHLGM